MSSLPFDLNALLALRARLDDDRVSRREIDGRWWCIVHEDVTFARPKAPNHPGYEGWFYYRPLVGRSRAERDFFLKPQERISDPICGIGLLLESFGSWLPDALLSMTIGRGDQPCTQVVLPDGPVIVNRAATLERTLLMAMSEALVARIRLQQTLRNPCISTADAPLSRP